MTIYFLDTNVVSDLMRRHPQVELRFRSCPGTIVTTVVTIGEIRYGLERLPSGKRRQDLTNRSITVLNGIPAEPLTRSDAERYGELRAWVERSGLKLNDNDLWIAAVVLNHNAVLVTHDSDFHRIPGIVTVDWMS